MRFVSDSLRCRIRDHGIRPDDVALPPTSVAPPRLVTQIRGVLDASRFTSSDGSPCRHRWSCRGTNEKPGRVQRRDRAFKLPLQGSNLDSPDPESGVLPVTPRGSWTFRRAEGVRENTRTPTRRATPQLRMMPRLSSLAVLVALLLGGCRAAVPPWGSSLDVAKRNADNAFAAFAFRFYNVQRDAKFGLARTRMGRFALIPSRIYDDSAIWSELTILKLPANARLRAGIVSLLMNGWQYSSLFFPCVP